MGNKFCLFVMTTVCCCLVYQRCHLPCALLSVSVCDRTRLVTVDSQGGLTSSRDTGSALLEVSQTLLISVQVS